MRSPRDNSACSCIGLVRVGRKVMLYRELGRSILLTTGHSCMLLSAFFRKKGRVRAPLLFGQVGYCVTNVTVVE